jgi:hypothetical protein
VTCVLPAPYVDWQRGVCSGCPHNAITLRLQTTSKLAPTVTVRPLSAEGMQAPAHELEQRFQFHRMQCCDLAILDVVEKLTHCMGCVGMVLGRCIVDSHERKMFLVGVAWCACSFNVLNMRYHCHCRLHHPSPPHTTVHSPPPRHH